MKKRYTRIIQAYETALGDDIDPSTVDIVDLLPAILEAVPDASVEEIAAALRQSADKDFAEADRLEHRGGSR